MTGIDTNILARYILRDDAAQTAIAARFLERDCNQGNPGFITAIVLCELVWVVRGYGYTREDIAGTVIRLLDSVELQIEHAAEARLALQDYAGGVADYADYFIARINQAKGATITVTFDQGATVHPLFKLLR